MKGVKNEDMSLCVITEKENEREVHVVRICFNIAITSCRALRCKVYIIRYCMV